jgi:membrane dipeptidase
MNTHFIPIFDGHNDTLLNLHLPDPGQDRSFFVQSEYGHIDLPRAQQGGLAGGFFAIFTPSPKDIEASLPHPETGEAIPIAPAVDQTEALRFTTAMAARLFRLEAEADGRVKVVRTVSELTSCLEQNVLAVILHIEGAEAIDPNLDALYLLYQAGLRSLGIVWSRPNAFACGVPFQFPLSADIGPGLTDAGRELVRTCNQLGILIDLSHLNEKGFWDVAQLSATPLVATHSCAYALCPSARNLTDKQLDAIRDSGGIVGINFHVGFLRTDGNAKAETSLAEIVRHLTYIADRIGLDHVALGSDFDGATMPGDLKDVAGLPKLMTALRSHGYDDAALRQIGYENWLRVLRQTWRA